MDSETIKKAWDECDLQELEQFNGTQIDPAVFKPLNDGEFIFDDRLENDDDELYQSIREMEDLYFMSEPLDGFLRCRAYVSLDDALGEISFRSYPNRIKISPAETDCPYEVFEHFINEFEDKVCELEFLGGLEAMKEK